MEMFYTHFLRLLDKERKNWRSNTVILQDGAPYHTSRDMMEFYEEHQVPLMLTGPHQYDGSPIELWFAAFKCRDINPERLPMGKK